MAESRPAGGRSDLSNWEPILGAISAASVAVIGYLVNQQANRRQRKAEFYGKALRAVKESGKSYRM